MSEKDIVQTILLHIDLKSGYWQIEMEADSVQKTLFVTSAGLFEYRSLPFGLKNAAATFQRLMEHVLKRLRGKYCLVYIDDIIVYSRNKEEHLQHINYVLQQDSRSIWLSAISCNVPLLFWVTLYPWRESRRIQPRWQQLMHFRVGRLVLLVLS